MEEKETESEAEVNNGEERERSPTTERREKSARMIRSFREREGTQLCVSELSERLEYYARDAIQVQPNRRYCTSLCSLTAAESRKMRLRPNGAVRSWRAAEGRVRQGSPGESSRDLY